MSARQQVLETIRQNPEFSVLIVGAGVNGIGLFRDLALQGIDVLLIDKGDFCSGASAASSHMVHGGLRYLENAEFRLVKEALTERNRLLQNAPHYVKPLPTTIPIFRWFSGMLNAPLKFLRLQDKPGERGAVVIKLGLTMYDLFTRGQQTLPRHKFTSRAKSLEVRSQLNPEIVCTATYYDAWMPTPERICIEMIADTEAESSQAWAVNYLVAVGAEGNSVTLRDEVSGETIVVQPDIVVNASGPWVDFTNKALQRQTAYIGGTKGSHLVVDHPGLHAATGGHEIFFENNDGRIVLIFPLQDKVLMGTTDIPIKNPDDARCTEEEVDYILGLVSKVFPKINVDRSHIVFRFTGVRPLPSSNAATAGQISRDHSIEVLEPGNGLAFPVYSLIGGKWTTFRAFSEQAADKVLVRLGKSRKVSTETMPIGGGKHYPQSDSAREEWINQLSETMNLPKARVQTLFQRYGTRAEAVAHYISQSPDEPLRCLPEYSRREITFLATQEKVVHLDDLILRRSLIAMLGQVNAAVLEELAGVLGEAMGWGEVQIKQEIDRTRSILQDKHGVELAG
jgi:glycerol-3-phosphate dehydrogenase